MSPAQQKVVDRLVDAARQVMHHDADEDSAAWKHEAATLAKKFEHILFNSPETRLLRRLSAQQRRRPAIPARC